MAREDLKWDDLQILLALVRQGTLNGATKHLKVNISTISRRLSALEEQLGLSLFDRGAQGLQPTAAVESLVPYAEEAEQAVHNFVRVADGYEMHPEGTVRVTAPPGVVEHFIAPILMDFYTRYPKIVVELDGSITYADLTRREADIALRSQRPQSGDLMSTRLGSSRDAIFASPTYAKNLGRLKHLDDARWISWGDELRHLPSARWVLDQVAATSIVLRTSRIGAQVAAAQAGLGAMLQPEPYRGFPGLKSVELHPSLAKTLRPFTVSDLWLVGHRALRYVPRVAVVWNYLAQHFRKALGPEA